LKKFADPTYDLAMYRCEEAIAKFKELPENHYATGWVLFQIGRAHMELVRYK
jgi:anaphase-promoting complex subunit 3